MATSGLVCITFSWNPFLDSPISSTTCWLLVHVGVPFLLLLEEAWEGHEIRLIDVLNTFSSAFSVIL